MLHVSKPYCDKITATSHQSSFPIYSQHFADLAESIGGRVHINEQDRKDIRLANNESIIIQDQHKLTRVTINGQACATLRLLGHFGEALGIVGQLPHKVTEIHTKVDVHGDNLPALLAVASSEALASGFCSVPSTACRAMVEVRPDEQLSHNTYIGTRKAEIQRVIYDKRLERHFRGYRKFDESIDELSVELRTKSGVTRKGLSLRDAYEAEPLFWHYMSEFPIIDQYRPADVKPWESSGSGFVVDRKMRTPADRLKDWLMFGDHRTMFRVANDLGMLDEVIKDLIMQSKKYKRDNKLAR